MPTVQTLIDTARERGYSARRLALATGYDVGGMAHVMRKARPMPPHLAAKIALELGFDPAESALSAVVSQEKDPARQLELARLLGIPADGFMIMSNRPRIRGALDLAMKALTGMARWPVAQSTR